MISLISQRIVRWLYYVCALCVLCLELQAQAPEKTEKRGQYLLLPQEALVGQAASTLGQDLAWEWSAFELRAQETGAPKPNLRPLMLLDLRSVGGWAAWLDEAKKQAEKAVFLRKPQLEKSAQGVLERVAYEMPYAPSLLLAHEALYKQWREQLGDEMLVLVDESNRLWLISALSPYRKEMLAQWEMNSKLSREFFLLTKDGLKAGGRLNPTLEAKE